MSVFSNKQIKQAIDRGHIVFHPYQEDHINGSSVDVTLGEWFYKTEKDRYTKAYNPFSQEDVDKYFDGPKRAERHQEWCERTNSKPFKGIPADHPIIVLKPGERILAHTHEFIGIKAPGTSTMQARSTWGRNGVAVCLDAGWGDPGYINRWTMEIYNMNQHESVVLPVGERIAQLVFYETGEVEGEYSSLSGKYQSASEANLDEIIKNWHPSEMLPKSYKDTRKKPLPVVSGEKTASHIKEVLKAKPIAQELSRHALLDILRSRANFDNKVKLKDKHFNYYTPQTLNSKQARRYEELMNQLYGLIEDFAIHDIKPNDLLHVLPFAHRFDTALPVKQGSVISINGEEGNFTDATKDSKKLIKRMPRTEAELIANQVYSASSLDFEDLLNLIQEKGYSWQHQFIKDSKLKFSHKYEVTGAVSEYFQTKITNISALTVRNGYKLDFEGQKLDIAQQIFDLSLKINSWLISENKNQEAEYVVLLGHRNRFIIKQ